MIFLVLYKKMMRIETHPIFSMMTYFKFHQITVITNWNQELMAEAGIVNKTHCQYLGKNIAIQCHFQEKLNFTLIYLSVSAKIMGNIKCTDFTASKLTINVLIAMHDMQHIRLPSSFLIILCYFWQKV